MSSIRWPHEYDPSRTPVFVSNEIVVPAAPETIWAWLVHARQWPQWYSNAHDVELRTGGSTLAPGMEFTWKTFGVSLVSTVREFEPHERLAWEAHASGVHAYHAWLLERVDRGRTRVLTEETQHGVLTRLQKLFLPNRMHRYHQIWLESLSERARTGHPPR